MTEQSMSRWPKVAAWTSDKSNVSRDGNSILGSSDGSTGISVPTNAPRANRRSCRHLDIASKDVNGTNWSSSAKLWRFERAEKSYAAKPPPMSVRVRLSMLGRFENSCGSKWVTRCELSRVLLSASCMVSSTSSRFAPKVSVLIGALPNKSANGCRGRVAAASRFVWSCLKFGNSASRFNLAFAFEKRTMTMASSTPWGISRRICRRLMFRES